MRDTYLRLTAYDMWDAMQQHQMVTPLVHDQILEQEFHTLDFVRKVLKVYDHSADMFGTLGMMSEIQSFKSDARAVRRCKPYWGVCTLVDILGRRPDRTMEFTCKKTICPHCHARWVGVLYRGLCREPTQQLYVYQQDGRVPQQSTRGVAHIFWTYRAAMSLATAHVKKQGRCFTGTRLMFDTTSHCWVLRLFAISSVPLGDQLILTPDDDATVMTLAGQNILAGDFVSSDLPGRFMRYDGRLITTRLRAVLETLAEITSCRGEFEFLAKRPRNKYANCIA